MGSAPHPVAKLAKVVTYVLGCRPDEFGLIPDLEGYVRTKRLLQALSEEREFRYVRESHLNEMRISIAPPVIEIRNHLIRAADRSRLPVITIAGQLPKLLYIGIRPRAYPVCIDKGVFPLGGLAQVVLARDPEMALRQGKRFAPQPILLTVQTTACTDAGVEFGQFGERLFVATHIPAGCFTGPPQKKESPLSEKPAKEPVKPKTPGSYFPALLNEQHGTVGLERARRNEIEWKKERRKARKEKDRGWV